LLEPGSDVGSRGMTTDSQTPEALGRTELGLQADSDLKKHFDCSGGRSDHNDPYSHPVIHRFTRGFEE